MAEKKSLKDMPGAVWGRDKYESHRGGGTPSGEENAFGEQVKINPSGKKRGGWHDAGEPGKREDEQPRDAEGHFTYNSMIGKPLKDVSKKNGKSRGTTIPPMFNGGVNGSKISTGPKGKEKQDLDAKASWDGIWFEKGTEVAAFGAGSKGQTVVKIAPEQIHEIAKEWVINKFDEQFEWKTVEGNKSHTFRTAKDENDEEYSYNLKDKDNGHKVLVYKGTNTPVNFRDLEENKGEFGRGNMKSQKEGTAKETGDISKWESKSGRPTEMEKSAKEETSKAAPIGAVKARDDEESDTMGGKVYSKYLEDEAAKEKQAELEKAEKAQKNKEIKAEREKNRKIRETEKGSLGGLEENLKSGEESKKIPEKGEEDKIISGLDTIKTSNNLNNVLEAINGMVSQASEKEIKEIEKVYSKFGVENPEELIKKVENEDIEQSDVYDAFQSVFNPGWAD